MRGKPQRQDAALFSPMLRTREMPANVVAAVPITYMRTTQVSQFQRDSLERIEAQRHRNTVNLSGECMKPPGSPQLSMRQIIEVPLSPDRYNSFEPAQRQMELQQRLSLRSAGSGAAPLPQQHPYVAGAAPLPQQHPHLHSHRVPASPQQMMQASTPGTGMDSTGRSSLHQASTPGTGMGTNMQPGLTATPVAKQSSGAAGRNGARSISPPALASKGKSTGLASSLSHAALRPKSRVAPGPAPSSSATGIRNVTPPASYRMVARPADYNVAKSPR